MGLFDAFSNKSVNTSTRTEVALDSYNRSFNNVRNDSNSNNLNIAVGASADPFAAPGDAVQKTALKAAGVVLVAAAIAWAYGRKK